MSEQHNPYQTPVAQPPVPQMGGSYRPTWKQILFSFSGRIRRSHYWAAFGVQVLIIVVMIVPLIFMSGTGEGEAGSSLVALTIIPALAGLFFVYWIGLAAQAKRWHDRNKSAWWILINFIPYLGGIWALIECGCLGGVEPNRFGPAAE